MTKSIQAMVVAWKVLWQGRPEEKAGEEWVTPPVSD